jgi:hypothetical protein
MVWAVDKAGVFLYDRSVFLTLLFIRRPGFSSGGFTEPEGKLEVLLGEAV